MRTPIPPVFAPFLLLAACLAGCASGKPQTYHDGDVLPVTVNGQRFNAELKLSRQSRFQGMGGRMNINDDFGMLFVYPAAQPLQFVMRDCHFPLAILFLDGQGRVVSSYRMPLDPPGTGEYDLTRYPSIASAQFALEVKADWLDKLKVVAGETQVTLPVGALTQAAE